MSRPKLAELSGVPYPTLAGLENDDQTQSTKIPAIAQALGVSASWLATGEGDPYDVDVATTSKSKHPNFERMAAAVYVLREYLEIAGHPSEWIADRALLELAYSVVSKTSGVYTADTLHELTKQLSKRIRAAQRQDFVVKNEALATPADGLNLEAAKRLGLHPDLLGQLRGKTSE